MLMSWTKIGYHLWYEDWVFGSTIFKSYVSEVRYCFSKLFLRWYLCFNKRLIPESLNSLLPKSEVFLINLTIKNDCIILDSGKIVIIKWINYQIFKEPFQFTYGPLSKSQGVLVSFISKFFCKGSWVGTLLKISSW